MRRALISVGALALSLALLFAACGSDPTSGATGGGGAGLAGASTGLGGTGSHAGKAGSSPHAGRAGAPGLGGQAGDASTAGTDAGGASGSGQEVPAWLTDESAWEPFAIDGHEWDGSVVSHSRPGSLGPSGFAWSACGDGCALLDTRWLGATSEFTSLGHVERAGTSTTVLAASWYRAPYGVRQVIGLETLQRLNALRGVSLDETKNPRYAGGWWREPRYFSVSPLVSGKHSQASDLWLSEDGTVAQSFLYDPPTVGRYFMTDAGQGRVFLAAGAIGQYGFGEGATEFSIVASGVSVLDGVGQGDLAVWLTSVSSSLLRVQGWRPDGLGTVDLLDVPRDPDRPSAYAYQVGLSSSRLVGTFSYALPDDPYVSSELRLWTSPRPGPGQKGTLTWSPPLPLSDKTITPAELKTWGDHVLLRVADVHQGKSQYWVIHLPTWTIYVLNEEVDKTKFVDRTYAIDDTFVYLGINTDGLGTRMTHVKRWELSKLAQTATQVLHAQ